MITGIVTTSAAAEIEPTGWENWVSPVKKASAAGTVDDEVEALQRRFVQHAPARLVDGDVAETLTL